MDSMLSLSEAKKYLSGISLRPLWPVEKRPDDPVCYPARYKNEVTFNSSLSGEYKKWCKTNSPDTVHGKGIRNNYPKRFLDFFAQTHLNIPNHPLMYGFVTDFNSRSLIVHRIQQPAKSLKEKLGPIGVEVLDEKGRAQTAFPIAFLEIMQLVIESDTSLREGYLIDEVLERYQADLLSRHKEHLKSFVNSNPITQACMDVSLAEEIKNFRAFWANRDSLIASAGQ
jgi:hypothetical protein